MDARLTLLFKGIAEFVRASVDLLAVISQGITSEELRAQLTAELDRLHADIKGLGASDQAKLDAAVPRAGTVQAGEQPRIADPSAATGE